MKRAGRRQARLTERPGCIKQRDSNKKTDESRPKLDFRRKDSSATSHKGISRNGAFIWITHFLGLHFWQLFQQPSYVVQDQHIRKKPARQDAVWRAINVMSRNQLIRQASSVTFST